MTIVLAACNRQGGVVNTHSGASRLSQWLIFGAECSFPPPRDSIRNAALIPEPVACRLCQGGVSGPGRFGHSCLGLTAGSCSRRTAVGGASGLPARCAEEERERAGGKVTVTVSKYGQRDGRVVTFFKSVFVQLYEACIPHSNHNVLGGAGERCQNVV
ncbi:hypothetical protein G5714_013286 [Onychostoma macrolepis]|uniref:Uncharacterized protein n=1 Tax=Onychostoma macrolepis TaxID=369639 RepID=A0A7J6CEV0_9TELE|nr:hypothetical protein G5714_013286 [Onychostoma macrolepis]